MRRTVVVFCLISLALARAAAADPFKPNENFQTLHTAHFRITYPVEYRFAAQKSAVLAEQAFALLAQRLKWTPNAPIDLFITDRTDYANGTTSVAPLQLINLYMVQPHTVDDLDYYDDWLRLLIFHEMTHAVHLDAVHGFPLFWRWVFGRVMPIGDIQPEGLSEGEAVLQESELTTKGRVRSSTSAMMVRMAALEDNWPPIDRLTVEPAIYPGGDAPYIWGALFNKYLLDHFGMEALAEYNWKHAGQIWPFLFNHNARVVFGSHLTDLYDSWTVDVRRWAERERDRIAAAGLTPFAQLTHTGYQHGYPRWRDDHTLIYSAADLNSGAFLRRLDLREAKPAEHMAAGIFAEARGLDVARDGAIVYGDSEPNDPWRQHFDLWRLNRGDVLPKQITTDLRCSEPAIVPGTDRAVCVSEADGKTRLTEVNFRTGAFRHLTDPNQFGGYLQMSDVAVHPSGKWLATAIWHDDGNRDIFRYDFDTGAFTRLTADPERDMNPAFDPSGRYLVFSSARSGVFNLYALDLQTDQLFRVTNIVGGAFMPAVDPTGRRLAFVSYSSNGYDIALMDFDPTKWTPVPREKIDSPDVVIGPISREIDNLARAENPRTDDYNPSLTAWPHWWFPDFSFGSDDTWLGVETGGNDIAGRHVYSLHALWSLRYGFPIADAEYSYLRFNPAANFGVAHTVVNHGAIVPLGHNTYRDYWERRVMGEAAAAYSILWRHDVYVGYVGQWRSSYYTLPRGVRAPPYIGYWSGAQVGWQYAIGQPLNRLLVFPAAVGATFYDPWFGGLVRQQLVGGQAGAYVPLPVRRGGVFAGAVGGASFGQQLPQRTFVLGGVAQADPTRLNYSNDEFALPGYSGGVARGDVAAVGTFWVQVPFAEIERGYSTWPIYLRDIYARAFTDAGFAIDRDRQLREKDLLPDVGGTLYIDLALVYGADVILSTTVADGFRRIDGLGGIHWLVNLGGLLP